MKVLIVGGYGVFGARLARLLVRDGHGVTIAGRNLTAAEAMARDVGCSARQFDRAGDLSALCAYQVVVDAAGPFHGYGPDPYRLARAAIGAGVHYLDLADDATFCAGIAALNAAALTAGVCVLSGLSTVPAISSAAVAALAGADPVRVIDTAILPGNRSPRGLSVMQSILTQAGRPLPVWRGNRWGAVPGWSDPARYTLPGGLVRQGWRIEVPDTRLFPAYFGAETVDFRAGLELWPMRYGLALFALFRRGVPMPVTLRTTKVFRALADLLARLGSGRGGMSVMVHTAGERRFWRLLAADGDGPFVPAVAARALLRRAELPAGAGPALCVVSLAEAEAAMADLAIVTERHTEPAMPAFARVLGPAFDTLPEAIRRTHMTAGLSRWTGRADILRGSGLWSRLLGTLFGFPQAGTGIDVEVTKTVTRHGENWIRRFGTRRFRSHLAASARGMTERFGPFTFDLDLTVKDAALHYPVRAGRVGPVPLPGWLLPRAEAREIVIDGIFHFDVALHAPLTGALIVHYRGRLAAAPRGDADAARVEGAGGP